MADPVSLTLISASLFSGLGGAAAGLTAAGTFAGISAGTYAAVAAGAGAGLAAMQGLQGRADAKYDAWQKRQEVAYAEVAAVQDSNKRTQALLDTLASRNAAYGARNVALGIGTPQALDMRDFSTYNEDERIGALNIATTRASGASTVAALNSKAQNSLYTGLINAGTTLSTYATNRAMIGQTPQTTAQAKGNVTTGAGK